MIIEKQVTAIKKFSLLIFTILLALGCSKSDDPDEIICSDEFRMIGLTVTGGSLDDFYTVRESTKDTIRFTDNGIYPISRWYPVLDDSYQEILKDTEEHFYFCGFADADQVVHEPFIIGADACHIFKVSGKESVAYSK